jgi:hypothetical protein
VTPPLLCHYATAGGLEGILTSKTLWATDAAFLNDTQEMRFVRDEVVAGLEIVGQRLIDSEAPALGGAEYRRGTVMRNAAEAIRSETPPDGLCPNCIDGC